MRTRSLAVTSWDGYVERWSTLHGGFDPRHASFLVRGWLFFVYWLSTRLAKLPLTPNAVTATGLVLSVAVPLVTWPGAAWPIAAAGLVVVSAVADTADGALA